MLRVCMLCCAVAISFASGSPVVAAESALQKPECSKASIREIETKLAAVKDESRKATAASEIAAAKRLMDQGRHEDCRESLLKANLQVK